MEDIIGPQKNHYKYLIGKNKNVLLDIKPNRFFFAGGGGPTLHSMWDLSLPIRGRTYAPCSGSRVLTTGPPEKSKNKLVFTKF